VRLLAAGPAEPARSHDDAHHRRVAGVVTRVSFLGNLVRYTVALQWPGHLGHPLTVDAPNTDEAAGFEVGAAVLAQWRRRDASVLSDASA